MGLVILSGVQAIEIASLKSGAMDATGRVSLPNAQAKGSSNDDMSSHHSGEGQGSQQSPQMVGGC